MSHQRQTLDNDFSTRVGGLRFFHSSIKQICLSWAGQYYEHVTRLRRWPTVTTKKCMSAVSSGGWIHCLVKGMMPQANVTRTANLTWQGWR